MTEPVRVDRARWLTVLADLARQAPARQQAYYVRLRRLRVVMDDDGHLSKPAARLRTAMGAASRRTAEDTLRFALDRQLLIRQIIGGKGHQAKYRACLSAELAGPKTEPVLRVDPRTGERLLNGRRPRLLPTPNGANGQATAPLGDASAHTELTPDDGFSTADGSERSGHTETASLPTLGCGPLVVPREAQPPASPAQPGDVQTEPSPDRNGTEQGGRSESRPRQGVPDERTSSSPIEGRSTGRGPDPYPDSTERPDQLTQTGP
jgi:hypothetical protein